jgi:hypothetical protein
MFGELFLNEKIFPNIQGNLGKFFLEEKMCPKYMEKSA